MATTAARVQVPVERLDVAAYVIPTEEPESDGTLEWDSTTIVVVRASSGRHRGIGYSYTDRSAALLIRERLIPLIGGVDASEIRRMWDAMVASVRNVGRQGIAANAISAVDMALWDLKARALGISLVDLLGAAR